jgi:hypothetical protein
MTKTLARALALIGTLSTLSLAAFDANAVELRVKCETRSDRSRGSVDGKDLRSGQYFAVFSSGANSATSPLEQTQGDEVEFDFDSNRRDIRQGATPIARNFIVNNQATGSLYNQAGTLVASKTVYCRRN